MNHLVYRYYQNILWILNGNQLWTNTNAFLNELEVIKYQTKKHPPKMQ